MVKYPNLTYIPNKNSKFKFIIGERASGKHNLERMMMLARINKLLEESPYVWSGYPNPVYDDGTYVIFRLKED